MNESAIAATETIQESLNMAGSGGLFIVGGIIMFMALIFISAILSSRRDEDEGYNWGSSYHNIDVDTNKLSSETFKINKFKNFCGVELECLGGHRKYFNRSELEDYGFSQVDDGSLPGNGVEYVSQPMNGDRLFKKIRTFCSELNKRNFKINTKCGYHLHMEVPKDLVLIKKLYIFYSKFEELFFKMLPKSRQNLRFCKKFRKVDKYDWNKVLEVDDMDDFKQLYYERNYYYGKGRRYYKKRYCWANFHSIFYRGTIEIRSHSGTINAEKIINWILIHLKVLNFVKKTSIKDIVEMRVTKENLKRIVGKELAKYIELRWRSFPTKRESQFKEKEKKK